MNTSTRIVPPKLHMIKKTTGYQRSKLLVQHPRHTSVASTWVARHTETIMGTSTLLMWSCHLFSGPQIPPPYRRNMHALQSRGHFAASGAIVSGGQVVKRRRFTSNFRSSAPVLYVLHTSGEQLLVWTSHSPVSFEKPTSKARRLQSFIEKSRERSSSA